MSVHPLTPFNTPLNSPRRYIPKNTVDNFFITGISNIPLTAKTIVVTMDDVVIISTCNVYGFTHKFQCHCSSHSSSIDDKPYAIVYKRGIKFPSRKIKVYTFDTIMNVKEGSFFYHDPQATKIVEKDVDFGEHEGSESAAIESISIDPHFTGFTGL